MADYYPLLARALDALPDRSPTLRKAVYDRARNALITQLRSLEPPLSEDDIDLERRALDAAIERLETESGGIPEPANDAAAPQTVVPAPEPEPVREVRTEIPEPETPTPRSHAPEPEWPEPASPEPTWPEPEQPAPLAPPPVLPPVLPPAAPPSFASSPPPLLPEPEPREAPIPIAPRRPVQPQPAQTAPEAAPSPAADPVPETAEVEPEAGNGRQRPRIEVVPPRAGRSRAVRNAFVGTVLVAVIALIAVAAFLLRDRPQALQANGAGIADNQQPEGEAKFSDRVGGESAPTERPRADAAGPARGTAPSKGAAPLAQPSLSVAQRASLIEENTATQGAAPTTVPGRVTWRLDSVNGEQGQPLQPAVTATVTYPDAGLTLVMTIQRNLDDSLPASHTIKLAFSQTGADAAARVVQDIGLLQAKDEESARGSPVSGLPVRVRDNLFLIGLSSLRNDVDRNTDLLLHRNWFDLAIRYTSGKRAVLAFEKGSAGAQAMQSAFDAWR